MIAHHAVTRADDHIVTERPVGILIHSVRTAREISPFRHAREHIVDIQDEDVAVDRRALGSSLMAGPAPEQRHGTRHICCPATR
jgi:hypothetical protein